VFLLRRRDGRPGKLYDDLIEHLRAGNGAAAGQLLAAELHAGSVAGCSASGPDSGFDEQYAAGFAADRACGQEFGERLCFSGRIRCPEGE
jgi:hypothetical protein